MPYLFTHYSMHFLLSFFLSLTTHTTMTTTDQKTEEGLVKAINRLIQPSEDFGIKDLESIYHQDMVVVMLDENNQKVVFRKEAFMQLIAAKLEEEGGKSNTWAQFLHTEVQQDQGHIIVKRRIDLLHQKSELTVILDFVWEDDRWQITRETIFSQPLK